MQTYSIVIDKNKKETTRHGEYEFPLAIYTTTIRRNILGFIDWHWHEELQLCIVTQGQVQFSINEDSLVLQPGEGLFINKGQLHRADNYQHSDGAYICLDFNANLLSGIEGGIIDTKYVSPYTNNEAIQYFLLQESSPWQAQVMQIIREIYEAYEGKCENYEFDIVLSLLHIWKNFIAYCFPTFPCSNPGSDKDRCKKIIAYIEAHYAEKIILDELAAELNLSVGTCCREFKTAMKCTIFEYIMNYRLTKSARLLLKTDESINEITYKCGFSNASYFIEQFKKKTKKTPHAYRKENKITK